MPERPAGVPANAEWDSGDEEWVQVPHPDERGRKHGLVTFWRRDGSLMARQEYRNGVAHGSYSRYHESGEVSRSGTYLSGQLHGVDTAYRSTAPTTELAFDNSFAEVIVRCETDVVHGRCTTCRCYDRDGNEVTLTGGPVPPRPAQVPAQAFLSPSDGWWFASEWDAAGGPGARVGLSRFWQPDGLMFRLEYYRDGKCVAIADRRPGHSSTGSPLIEAGRDNDDAAVEACLAAGLGVAAGAALHAAYAGLPALALRLTGDGGDGPRPAEPGSEGGGTVPRWPEKPEPARAGNVDPRAVWVPATGPRGGWLLGDLDAGTGAATGTWRLWKDSLKSEGDDEGKPTGWDQTEFSAGRPARWREYYGFRLRRPEDLATSVHEDGFPLREELEYGEDGGVRVRRDFHTGEPGQLYAEIEAREDGTAVRRLYDSEGRVSTERVTRGDELVTERWHAPDGSVAAEVSPAAEPWLDDDGKPVPAELWRGLDGGQVIAEGLVWADGGDPVGPWRLLDADGTQYATVDFRPLTSSLSLGQRHDLGQVAVALHAWEQAPWPAALAGVHEVDWASLDTFFGTAQHFPFLLKGLAQPDPMIVGLALDTLIDPILHQQTIEEAAGPVVRYLVALAPRQADDGLRARILGHITNVATRNGSLGAVAAIKRVYRALPPGAPDPEQHFRDADVEPAYHEVYDQVSAATAVWSELAASPHRPVRHSAQLLLAAAVTEDAATALRQCIAAEPDPALRADAVLGLFLHGDTEPTRDLLAGLMADAATDPLAAFCAALSWIRLRATPAEAAVDLVVRALRDDLDTTGFGQLYLASSSATTDATTTLALLPPEQAGCHLDRLCAALDEVNSINAVSVARALLDIVFPRGYYADQPLTGPQRQVIAAIAASGNAWTFNANLHEVLRYNMLPASREDMRALASDIPAGDAP